MPIRTEIQEGLVPVKIYTTELEAAARQQLVNISKLPIVHHHVAAMPDVHLGIGATVGSVIPTKQAIIPAAVGVDIGCGMIARRAGRIREPRRSRRARAGGEALQARPRSYPRPAPGHPEARRQARELGA